MARIALLIGASTFGLEGVDADVAAMDDTLTDRGFKTELCTGTAATRDGILGAYERVISDAGPDDAVVVHYSGHGSRVAPTADGIHPGHHRFIVPVDFSRSTPDDFRGITGLELSVLLARLTERTRNVTVALDCCFAGTMSRDGELVVRALPEARAVDLRAHLDRRLRAGLRIDLTRPLGNPYAVRLVACAPEQRSHEYGGRRGERIGVFTEALTDALREAGPAPVTWSAVLPRVRQKVLDVLAGQRPDVEGPAHRRLFGLTEDDAAGSLPVVAEDRDRVRLDGAPLLGVQPGDRFTIMPPTANGPDPAGSLGSVLIDGCGPAAATGRREPARFTLPVGARAFRVGSAVTRLPVLVPPLPGLVAAVSASTFVRPAGPGERHAAEVRTDSSGELTVTDAIGPLHAPRPAGPSSVRPVVKDLERLARAAALRGITELRDWDLDARISLEWGRVTDGRPSPLPVAGALLSAGDPVYLAVRNDGPAPVWVSLIDIGVSARITVLNADRPAGHRLDTGQSYTFGHDDRYGRLTGVPLSWPAGLDPRAPRPETILVIITPRPEDLSVLEQDSVSRSLPGSASPLGSLLRQVSTGSTRELRPQASTADRYTFRIVDFDLDPGR